MRIRQSRYLCWYLTRHLAWVRVFDRGLLWKNTRHHPLIFSERNGHWRMLQIGPYVLRYLPKPPHWITK